MPSCQLAAAFCHRQWPNCQLAVPTAISKNGMPPTLVKYHSLIIQLWHVLCIWSSVCPLLFICCLGDEPVGWFICYLWNLVFHTRKHLLTLYEAGTKASSLLRGELSHLEQRMGWIVSKTVVLENNNNNDTILHKMWGYHGIWQLRYPTGGLTLKHMFRRMTSLWENP